MDGEWGLGLNAIDVSSLTHALGKLFPSTLDAHASSDSADVKLVQECAEFGMEAILALVPPALGPQAIANIVNGLSRLGLLSSSTAHVAAPATLVDEVLRHLDASIEAVGAAGGKGRGGGWMERFEPRHISMLVNGWARLQVTS